MWVWFCFSCGSGGLSPLPPLPLLGSVLFTHSEDSRRVCNRTWVFLVSLRTESAGFERVFSTRKPRNCKEMLVATLGLCSSFPWGGEEEDGGEQNPSKVTITRSVFLYFYFGLHK